MPSNIAARLRRLEARQMATDRDLPRIVVVYEDDPLPDDIRASDLVIRVEYDAPRKVESVEAWERRQGNGRPPRDAGDTT